MEESSQVESYRPDPLRSLVIVCSLGYAGVRGLVGVVVLPPVGPVPGLEGGEAEGSEEAVRDCLEGGAGVAGDVGAEGERNDVVTAELVVSVLTGAPHAVLEDVDSADQVRVRLHLGPGLAAHPEIFVKVRPDGVGPDLQTAEDGNLLVFVFLRSQLRESPDAGVAQSHQLHGAAVPGRGGAALVTG